VPFFVSLVFLFLFFGVELRSQTKINSEAVYRSIKIEVCASLLISHIGSLVSVSVNVFRFPSV